MNYPVAGPSPPVAQGFCTVGRCSHRNSSGGSLAGLRTAVPSLGAVVMGLGRLVVSLGFLVPILRGPVSVLAGMVSPDRIIVIPSGGHRWRWA